jgi:methyl-accepting chemotaxis protein
MTETDENEELDKFNKLSYSSKMDVLDEKFNNFEEEIGKLEESSQIITNLINKEKMLIDKDCSIYADGSRNNSLNEINNIEYKKCRENKKMKQKKIIEYLKDNFSCKSLSSLISKDGISKNIEDNIKYIVLLIEEVTNKVDSFSEGDSKVLLNMITCIQENFEDYWKQLKEYLDERGVSNITISEVKQDISRLSNSNPSINKIYCSEHFVHLATSILVICLLTVIL